MQVFSSEIFENFENTYFEEHLRTAAPERLRKPSPLLVSGKPLLGSKRATNMNLMKLVSAIFTLYQNAFWYFFQASEESKSGNDNNFKIS